MKEEYPFLELMAVKALMNAKVKPDGATDMNQSAVNAIVGGGGSLVVAQWEAKEGQAEAAAAILRRFPPTGSARSQGEAFPDRPE